MCGSNGYTVDKNEGDFCTPQGIFSFQKLYYRADRVAEPLTQLPHISITPDMGWCDDPLSLAYNRLVQLPTSCRHEKLWREDNLYDILLVISHNTGPSVVGKGSAIFFHIWRSAGSPTQGCIAMSRENMLRLCRELSPGDDVILQPFP
ncbi:MAG: L,D-transpeptidase family protein [Alphaproteobacteria bacterium]|nr:MAG: L,D-transpeptidase family protein [Alphaproteobacteria bacterium]